jgi:hypothetical protein
MRLGEIVRSGRPQTAVPAGTSYTQALLAAIPGRQRKEPPISPDTPRDDLRH